MLLRATDFHATYTVSTPFTLPAHPGSLIHGVLGRALRRTGCAVPETPCPGVCGRPEACTYARLFDPLMPSPPPHRFLQGGTRAPPRLIPLLPAMGTATLVIGDDGAPGGADHPASVALATHDTMGFGVRVLGEVDDATEKRLVSALEGIDRLPLGAEHGAVEFMSVTRVGHRNRPTWVDGAPRRARRVKVAFTTPAWLEHEGALVKELTFSRLFRAISRRLTTVCALYGELGVDQEASFARLDALAGAITTVESRLRPQRWERLSEERGARHLLCGLTGWAVFEGELGEFLPMLTMGAGVHVGKSTSFGLGRMRVCRAGVRLRAGRGREEDNPPRRSSGDGGRETSGG